ncbi:cytoplasmic dynein 2 heavy chain 1-like [Saccostrea cucullata]|uniref:cytoplasmic dynein 2 heavy chain 1-like n=1 Tax=Saccostrea cuccullata TaxID=36930 RepID=UPI002ED0075B
MRYTERKTYLPLAESGSRMYFVISDLTKINNMYRFSLAAYLRIFQKALKTNKVQKKYLKDDSETDHRIRALTQRLQNLVYEYVRRSLFKADRLMFALHMDWEGFTGILVTDVKSEGGRGLPSWVDQERHTAVTNLKNNFPKLYQVLNFDDGSLWSNFSHSNKCEKEFPSVIEKQVTLFQQLLVVQAVGPDKLQTVMVLFACKALGMKELSPSSVNLKRLLETETLPSEPILIIISHGADSSQELQDLAAQTIGGDKYHQVAMGQGQSDIAMQLLRECAQNVEWLCLKNLHLVTAWLPQLEKEINTLKPLEDFRL